MGKRRATRMTGLGQLAFVVGLFLLLPPLSILDGESKDSTPPLPEIEEQDVKEVDIPYTSSLGLFEEIILWKGFINTQPIDKPILYVPPMKRKLDSELNEIETDGEYIKGGLSTVTVNP